LLHHYRPIFIKNSNHDLKNIKMANKKKTTKTTGQLDHVEALLNVANFLVRYKKWYAKWQKSVTTTDDDGSNPGGPKPPPPPMP